MTTINNVIIIIRNKLQRRRRGKLVFPFDHH